MCLTIRGNDFIFFFEHKRAINRARRAKIDPKIGTFCRIGIRDLAILGHFGGQKSRILAIFKVVLELFKKYLGIVFRLRRPIFKCIVSSKGL